MQPIWHCFDWTSPNVQMPNVGISLAYTNRVVTTLIGILKRYKLHSLISFPQSDLGREKLNFLRYL